MTNSFPGLPNPVQPYLKYASDVIIYLNKSLHILGVNSCAEQFFQWNEGDVLGYSFPAVCRDAGFETLAQKNRLMKAANLGPNSQQDVIVTPDGEERTLSWGVIALPELSAPDCVYLLVGQMLGGQSMRPQALQYYLESVVMALPGSIYWKNKDGVYQGCTNFMIQEAGFSSKEELIGKTDYDFFAKEQADELRDNDRRVMASGEAFYSEELVDFGGDVQKAYTVVKVPLRDDHGNIIGIMGNSLDITELKSTQAALAEEKQKAEIANRSKSNFLAAVSHELRTPLNGILGMAEIALKSDGQVVTRDYLRDIYRAGSDLLTLVSDILDFSKLEEGKMELEPAAFNVADLLHDVKMAMQYQVKQKDELQLIFEKSHSMPTWLIGDRFRLRQVLLNLVGNAIKFTKSGYVKLLMEGESKAKGRFNLRVSVEDTGVGIPDNMLDRIFDRFSQVEGEYGRRFQGVGLGLSICRQLIAMMNGAIDVKSMLDKGSIFWFNVPLMKADAKAISQAEPLLVTDLDDEGVNFDCDILLVEDNPLNQKIAKIMLEEWGCRLVIAEHWREAFKALEKKSFDLVFMDVGLPEMDGLQITQKIRAGEGEDEHISIIAMTAHALVEDQERCIEAGMDDVITKPVTREQLYEKVKGVMAQAAH